MQTETARLTYKRLPLEISCNLGGIGNETVVFIHGLGACKDSFKHVWQFGGFEGYRVLTFDLPGFGDSSRPHEFSYSMGDQAGVCNLLLSELGLGGVHLVCHSMGGAIGLIMASRPNSPVKSFVCVEGNLLGDDCTGSRTAVGYSLKEFLDSGFSTMKRDIAKHAGEIYLSCLSRCSPYAFYRSSESLVAWSDSEELMEMFLTLPAATCYIYGEQSACMPVINRLSQVAKYMVPEAGHGVMTDNPRVFYSRLLKFIRGVS